MNELDFKSMPKWMPEALEIMMLIEVWAKAYEVPREAIIRQIPIAYAWSQSNGKKAPKKHIVRFLFTWMKSAKRWGNLAPREPNRLWKEVIPKEEDIYVP